MFERNRYSHLLYKRGYLITDFKTDPPKKSWKYHVIGNYHIFHDSEIKFAHTSRKQYWIALIGYAIDTINWTVNTTLICDQLLDKLLYSNDVFYEYIDHLSGRFVLIYGNKENSYLLTDACGLRSAFYSTDESKLVVSSHQNLAGRYLNASPIDSDEIDYYYSYSTYSLPGDITLFKNVFFLIPNHYLNLNTREVTRFFPRNSLSLKNVSEISEELNENLKRQFLLMNKYYKLNVSLSAGIDSRTTLALTKEIKDDILFFTYFKEINKKDRSSVVLNIDREVVRNMVRNLDLNHIFLPIDSVREDQNFHELVEVLKHNSSGHHSFKLAKLYFDNFDPTSISIRSNIPEIARAFYQTALKLPKKISPEAMALCYSRRAVNSQNVMTQFKKFYLKHSYDQLMNYDPYALFYWEYRMGTWHSRVLLESDIASETFIVYNSRNVLNKMLSLSLDERKNGAIFQALINMNWPVLNYWKINSTKTLSESEWLLKRRVLSSQLRKKDFENEFMNAGCNLDDAIVITGSRTNKKRTIPLDLIRFSKRMRFFMNISNPKKGDFVSFKKNIETIPNKSYLLSLQIRSPYENPKNNGRIIYRVLLNNQTLLTEDIAMWGDPNFINIKWVARASSAKLEIRVEAIKNCESWSWGKAAKMFIEGIFLREINYNGMISISATSPHSKIYLQRNKKLYDFVNRMFK